MKTYERLLYKFYLLCFLYKVENVTVPGPFRFNLVLQNLTYIIVHDILDMFIHIMEPAHKISLQYNPLHIFDKGLSVAVFNSLNIHMWYLYSLLLI